MTASKSCRTPASSPKTSFSRPRSAPALLTSEQEIVKRSQQHAAEILSAAQKSAKELTRKATLYCETILKNSEEVLGRSMADIKNTRMNLRSAARPKNNMPK
ncbi:hypothetical protein [Gemmiger formicilis]|uniref:hypothetical protein n=1 Tax=Gemmiger formicilis TaxID=745368 RepID=UPI0035207C3A